MNDSKAFTRIVALLFCASGAAGLIYESAWSRYMALFVGHSSYAQLLVLAIYLGGMSVGALFLGARSAMVVAPLRAYGAIEIGVGALGLAFHLLWNVSTNFAYAHLLGSELTPLVVVIGKWTIASLLILPQSLLLGATFPLVATAMSRQERGREGAATAHMYFVNSLGAVIGVVVSGFVLLQAVGLSGLVLVAAFVNLVVGFAAISVSVRNQGTNLRDANALVEGDAPQRDVHTTAMPRLVVPLLIGATFASAAASFIYEVVWIRMLSLVLGSASHSFELMLAAFITGLAAGAWWIRRRLENRARVVELLINTQWIMGALAIATLPIYVRTFFWTDESHF